MQDIDGETTAYIIIEVLIAFLSISGNGLVCYVVMNNRSMRKKVNQSTKINGKSSKRVKNTSSAFNGERSNQTFL